MFLILEKLPFSLDAKDCFTRLLFAMIHLCFTFTF